MDSTDQVCRCVVWEKGSSGLPRRQCMGPSSKKISSGSSTSSSTSSSIVKKGPKSLRDSSLQAQGEARAKQGRKRRTSHLPPLSQTFSHQHDCQAGSRHPAPRGKENNSGSGSGSGSCVLSRALAVNSNSSVGPGRIRKRDERSLARSNNSSSSPCFSTRKAVQGEGGGGGGEGGGGGRSTQHRSKSSRNPLDHSPYANRVSFANKNLPMDATYPGQRSQTPPLPALKIATRPPEKREADRTSEQERNVSRASSQGSRGERNRCFGGSLSPSSDGCGDGVGSTAALDSPRSIDTANNSLGTLVSTVDIFDDFDGGTIAAASAASSAISAAADGDGSGQAETGLGIADRTLFESWKELPWQARVCPRAIEDQEVVRMAAALEAESLRVQSWRQEQQALATRAAKDEERVLSGWWRQEAEKVWARQSRRQRDHAELATRLQAELAARESQGADLLGVGYGAELAQLNRMDQSDHLERLKRLETLFTVAVGETNPNEAQDTATPGRMGTSRNSDAGEDAGAVTAGSFLPTSTTTVGGRKAPPEEQEEAATDAKVKNEQEQEKQQQQQPGGVVQLVQGPTKAGGESSLDAGRIEMIRVQEQSELEQVELHASTAVAAAERFCRRRQSLVHLFYRGLAAVYRDVRAVARRMFLSECAADIGRIKQLASSSSSSSSSCRGGGEEGAGEGGVVDGSSGTLSRPSDSGADGLCGGIARCGTATATTNGSIAADSHLVGLAVDSEGENENLTTAVTAAPAPAPVPAPAPAAATGPEAARSRESRRVTQELQTEANRVAFWDKVQREVLRRSTTEATKLLAADSLRRPLGEGGRAQASHGGAESIQAFRKRARASMRKLRGRQAAASFEARSVERSWMAALARWVAQLGKARAAAISGEIGELRILQQEDAEALAAQESAAVYSLATRRDALAQSWENLLQAERTRIADTAWACRHSLLSACTRLRALVEESQRERSRTVQSWNDQHARALERSRLLADVIDREAKEIDDGHSALLVDLARIVAGDAEEEAEAVAAARRDWWAEARESLLSLFVSAHSSSCSQTRRGSSRLSPPRSENGGGKFSVTDGVDDVVDDSAPEKAHVPAAPSLLVVIRARLDDRLRAEETRAAKAKRDILAGAVDGGGEEAGGQAPLHLAVAEKQQHKSEAIGRCLEAVDAARCDPSARGGGRHQRSKEEEANPAAAEGDSAAAASSREGSGDGSGDGDGDGDGERRRQHNIPEEEQEMGSFLSGLETGAVQLAAISFEEEVRLLAIGPATPPPETNIEEKEALPSPPPSEDGPPGGDLTRSQLDLRRTARVRALARALAGMLCRGREALLKKTLQLGEASQREYSHSVSVDVSRHSRRVDELQTRARAQGEEALKDALTQIETRSQEISSRLRAAAAIRRRVIGSVAGWIDVALEANLRRLERRRCRWREQEQYRAGALEKFERTVLEEQREWLLRAREQRRKATEVARTVIADQVAEIVHQHRRQAAAAEEEEGKEEEEKEGGSAGDVVTAEGTALLEDGVYADGVQPNQPDDNDGDDDDDDDDEVLAAPSLDDRVQAEAVSALAAVERSCLAGVDSWAEETRRRAWELERSWAAEAASHDREEHGAAKAELETLELAFLAARKDAEEAATDSRVLLLPPPLLVPPDREDGDDFDALSGAAAGGTTTTAAGSGDLAATEGGAGAENEVEEPVVPEFVAKEQEECRAFWSSFEPPLASLQLELGTTESTRGAGEMSQQREGHDQEGEGEEKEEGGRGESVVRAIAGLESDLRDELAEAFRAARKREEVEAMVRDGDEELRLAFVLIGEERRAKRQEKRDKALALLLAAEEEERRREAEHAQAEAERANEALLLEEEEDREGEGERKANAFAQGPAGAAVLDVPTGGG